MREIILDTETTGLNPEKGDRLVEIGCLEIINRIPTGQTLHLYINPQRDMPEEAFRIHGLSIEFLSDKPLFAEIADAFLAFIGDSPLVIHNGSFDLAFINAELRRLGRDPVGGDRLIDTLAMARRRFPGQQNNLDALCARFGIDNSKRTKHGALMDSELLAEVYIELVGGRQTSLSLADATTIALRARAATSSGARSRPMPLASRLTPELEASHAAFIAQMGDKAIWNL